MQILKFHEFRLAGPNGNGRDLYLNENGAFIANGIPLLDKGQDGRWRPKAKLELEKKLSKISGVPIDFDSRMTGLNEVAKALNKGDLALANIALVLLRLPIESNDIAKYNPDQPRAPAGGSDGGQWTNDEASLFPVEINNNSTRHPFSDYIIPAAYNGVYHDIVVMKIANYLLSHGNSVEVNVPFTTIDGETTAIADIVLQTADPGAFFILEVKTGDNPKFTLNQRIVYPMAGIGEHVYSSSWKIKTFGFAPGVPLPPIQVMQVYAAPGEELKVNELPPEYEKFLKSPLTIS